MTNDFARLTILVVDDDPTMRSVITSALRAAGCNQVRQASNGEQALNIVRQAHIDLITCDYQMAPVDGLTFVKRLRELPEGATKPVVMLTANNRPEDAWAGRELKVSAWLVKPITPQAVIKRVASVLGLQAGAVVPEDVLTELADAYEKRLPAEIQTLESIAARLPARPEHFDANLQDLVKRLHVVKGQAGTLGYALLGTVAGEVHDVLQEAERLPPEDTGFRPDLMRLVDSAFKVMRLIVDRNVRGSAGAVGAKVMADITGFAHPLRGRILAAVETAEVTERDRRNNQADALLASEQQRLLVERRIRLTQAEFADKPR
jgi:two-component system chemotaxis response regulator CheY